MSRAATRNFLTFLVLACTTEVKASMAVSDLKPSSSFGVPLRNEDSKFTDAVEDLTSIPPHPIGVKPSGNLYTATSNLRESIGFFQILPDEILAILLEFLDIASLLCVGATCKALYAFSTSEELWKSLFLEYVAQTSLPWRGTWRSTLLRIPSNSQSNISCDGLYSDVLYRPFLCTYTSLIPFTTCIPPKNLISRLDDLSPQEFASSWSDVPFILSKPVREWPVYDSWDTTKLLEMYNDVSFRAEALDWPLKSYVEYMNNSMDESPLYLFDSRFVEKMQLKVGRDEHDSSYWIPDCFGEDLFSVLSDKRPDSRWLIIGPARSGSTFHKDPNATSAWNAVLRGSKYWIMFPTNRNTPPPPGVYVSADQSEVTSPLSIAEWLIGFHAEARRTPGCIEGICNEGEVLHVPSGWWHLVVNLEPSIAITQNFVPRSHLTSALSFLKNKADQVSGFKKEVTDPYSMFVQCMRHAHSDLLTQSLEELDKEKEGKKRKWNVAVGGDNGEGFSFGFGGDGDSDEEIP